MQGFSHYPSLWEVLFYFWERKKSFCFIPLYMHIIDNNNIVTGDAGSWWLVFVKAKMWFGSGRDSASLSSSSRSLNLSTCSVSGFAHFLKILVWSPDLWFELYFCLIFLLFLPHQLQGQVNKKNIPGDTKGLKQLFVQQSKIRCSDWKLETGRPRAWR